MEVCGVCQLDVAEGKMECGGLRGAYIPGLRRGVDVGFCG